MFTRKLEDNMSISLNAQRIPPEILAEQWYIFLHSMIAGMQSAYRDAQFITPELNQQVIAENIGRKASFVSRCLSGQQNMTARTIHDISRGMGYRPQISFQPLSQLIPSNRPSAQSVPQGPTGAADNSTFYSNPSTNSASIGALT